MFPRSATDDPARHGTFADVISVPAADPRQWASTCCTSRRSIRSARRTARAATTRCVPNRATSAVPMPSAVPRAGTTRSIRHSARSTTSARWSPRRRDNELEIALDFAIQCSPDHPWLREHHDWFRWRPDGSMRYAENPPKKYEDIVNPDFYAEAAMPGVVVGAARCGAVLGRSGRAHLPRRQPAHQAAAVLALDDRRYPRTASRCAFPGGGVHPAEDDVPAGKDRLHPVLHLLHLAKHQAGDHRVPDGTECATGARILPAEFLRQHTGYQSAVPADVGPARLSDPCGAGLHAVGPVGHVFRV